MRRCYVEEPELESLLFEELVLESDDPEPELPEPGFADSDDFRSEGGDLDPSAVAPSLVDGSDFGDS